jgi:hypothetical protein
MVVGIKFLDLVLGSPFQKVRNELQPKTRLEDTIFALEKGVVEDEVAFRDEKVCEHCCV